MQGAIGAALLLLALPCEGKHVRGLSHLEVLGRRHSHKRLTASPKVEGIEAGLVKRGSCQFPSSAGLFAVTPGKQNAGWAMSPDEPCKPGNYCPYACPAGQVMAQWDPKATSYTYPQSMNGGLYCDSNGQISKPFPSKPYCVDATGPMGVQNNCGSSVAFCQTVLPGNEAMLIPTQVDSSAQLAVPDPSYWCSTAAHYYINAPGVSTSDACIWGDGSKPIGNWAPYVAGANTDKNGNTFAKIGWNPIWTGSNLASTLPTFGIKIECVGGGCNGLPCSIDPSTNGMGGVTSSDQSTGAGGANFCVATIPKGSSANIVVFTAGNSNSKGSSSAAKQSSSSSSPAPSPTTSSTTSASPTPTPTTSSILSSSSSSSSTTPTSTTFSTSSTSSQTSSALLTSTSSTAAATTSSSSSSTFWTPTSSINTTSSAYPTASNSPHILFENQTVSQTIVKATGTGNAAGTGNITVATAAPSATKKSAAPGTLISGSTILLGTVFAVASTYLL
ncbi:hypothetical protein BGZ60DRAFT_384986 [Tricladium varicosporioides]|nr:hypothetical protein BGZ60DRAFT_384986 [Hymenoscyphus varicosporioides]